VIQEVTQERKSIRVGETNGMIGTDKVTIIMTFEEKAMTITIRTQDIRKSEIYTVINMRITTNTVKENTTALMAEATKIWKVSLVLFQPNFSNDFYHVIVDERGQKDNRNYHYR
jgi:hypothetical protein